MHMHTPYNNMDIPGGNELCNKSLVLLLTKTLLMYVCNMHATHIHTCTFLVCMLINYVDPRRQGLQRIVVMLCAHVEVHTHVCTCI